MAAQSWSGLGTYQALPSVPVPGVSPLSGDVLDDPALRVAVLVPCLDEEASVGRVVEDYRAVLPRATIYVYDNGSTDATAAVAAEAGAVVRREPEPGKGNVVRRMFADIDADVYVMVDGDDTYEAQAAPGMIRLLLEQSLDMVVGNRVSEIDDAYRRGHMLGNRLFNWLHQVLFGSSFRDVFSGYRVMSRRLVKSFPTMANGFEIEAELTVHALDIKAPFAEVPTRYQPRGEESASKLRTFRDGRRILLRSLLWYKEIRPARFFGAFFALFAVAGLVLGIPVVDEYARTRQVPRFPSAILAASLEMVGFLFLAAGVILDSIARRHREVKRLHYLQHAAPIDVVRADRSGVIQGTNRNLGDARTG
jgi:glycosyltransferase involved in cell wall biosynthesis